MTIEISIKNKKILFPKVLSYEKLGNLLYEDFAIGISRGGVFEEISDLEESGNYSLHGTVTLGTGFSLSLPPDGKSVSLSLNIPTTHEDILDFFEAVYRISDFFGAHTFLENGREVKTTHIPDSIGAAVELTDDCLSSALEQSENLVIFGAMYPVHLPESFIHLLKSTPQLNQWEVLSEYLHEKQQGDDY